jgi:phage host-nuclease inhibitor protein Gam
MSSKNGKVKIKNLAEADSTLQRIAEIQAKLKKLDAEAEGKINPIKQKTAAAADPLVTELKTLDAALLAFTEEKAATLFSDKQSVSLTFGKLYRRVSHSIEVSEDTIERLEKGGFTGAISVKESVNKNAVKIIDRSLWDTLGISEKENIQFGYETSEAAVTKFLMDS